MSYTTIPAHYEAEERLRPPYPHRSRRTLGPLRNVPRISGTIVGFIAVISFLSSLSPAFRWLISVPRDWVDSNLFFLPDTSFAWFVVITITAAALAARKRIAWWIVVIYFSGWVLLNVIDLALSLTMGDLNAFSTADRVSLVVGVTIQLIVLGVMVAAYHEFYTRVRRGALFKAIGVGFVLGFAGSILGWGLVTVVPGTVEHGYRFLYALNRVGGFGLFNDSFPAHGHTNGFVNTILGLIGAVALIVSATVLFRSQRSTNSMTGDDEQVLRKLLDRFGQNDSLGYFATRRDKAVVWAPNARAAITYRTEFGVGLASGDPIGDPDYWQAAIKEWLNLCDAYGWTPAVMGASTAGAKAYTKAGLQALSLGDEAILHTDNFSLKGADMKGVRQAVTRARRAGISVRIRRHSELSEPEIRAMITQADAWRDTATERGFSMALGRLGDPADGDCLLVEALHNEGDAHEKCVAMLSMVPWTQRGVSLDVMRRSRNSPNGVIELMVTELAQRGDQLGIRDISLNFAVFRSVFSSGAEIGAGPVLRFWRAILVFFSRWWQLEALYRSNVKYHPDWNPRYICFPENRDMAKVGIGSAIAEGYLVFPGQRSDHQDAFTGVHRTVPNAGLQPDFLADTDPEREVHKRRPEQVRVRLKKLATLEREGIDAYPVAYQPTHSVADAVASPEGTTVRLAGRILRTRDYGGVVFADLRDWSGDVQLLFDRSYLNPDTPDFASFTDLGDLIEVTGTVGRSRNGVLSLLVKRWRMNGKCLQPLPDKWRGLSDPEARVRRRYVDLAINDEARQTLQARSAVLTSLRDSFNRRGFIEVETPILQQIHGGANATPFKTHINAYDLDLYLRIAPELYLKRLCVGGVEKVFELGRTFRNEGVDFSHNPEFSILEAYEAHSDYERMRILTQETIQAAAIAAHGRPIALRPNSRGGFDEVDISGDWPVKTLHGAVSEALGTPISADTSAHDLKELCREHNIPFQPQWDSGQIALEMYEHLVEDRTTHPTFYKDFPISVSPLTRSHRSVPGVTERWDLVAWGVELGTAYSELTDPVEQRRRLTSQSLLAAGGDPEAMELDEDFLTALEYAMPPTGGLGLGVDRIVMLITGRSIRETLPFPLAKPR